MARLIKTSKRRAQRAKTPKPPTVRAKSGLGPVAPSDIELVHTSGTMLRGGGARGEAWIVMAEGKRAGTAYINVIEDSIRGSHASFHVFLNRPSQGRQIGRRAYQLGCANSQHEIIYAHMRKSNIASRNAAFHAGFINATAPEDSQLVLVWYRKPPSSRDEAALESSNS